MTFHHLTLLMTVRISSQPKSWICLTYFIKSLSFVVTRLTAIGYFEFDLSVLGWLSLWAYSCTVEGRSKLMTKLTTGWLVNMGWSVFMIVRLSFSAISFILLLTSSLVSLGPMATVTCFLWFSSLTISLIVSYFLQNMMPLTPKRGLYSYESMPILDTPSSTLTKCCFTLCSIISS